MLQILICINKGIIASEESTLDLKPYFTMIRPIFKKRHALSYQNVSATALMKSMLVRAVDTIKFKYIGCRPRQFILKEYYLQCTCVCPVVKEEFPPITTTPEHPCIVTFEAPKGVTRKWKLVAYCCRRFTLIHV